MLVGGLASAPRATAAANNGDSSFPLPDGTQPQMHVTANCVLPDKQCYFTTQADRNTADGITLNNLETQVVAANTRQFKEMGRRGITTGGPVHKYRVTGQTQPTDWQTGQPLLTADYIVCAETRVVYSGVNIISPSTCAQTTFS